MKKIIILALLGSTIAATPALATTSDGFHGNDWREYICKISPRRCR